MHTIVFGWIVMLRSDGLQTCMRANQVWRHQFVTVPATIKERQISSRSMFLIESAVVISVRSTLTTYMFKVVPC